MNRETFSPDNNSAGKVNWSKIVIAVLRIFDRKQHTLPQAERVLFDKGDLPIKEHDCIVDNRQMERGISTL